MFIVYAKIMILIHESCNSRKQENLQESIPVVPGRLFKWLCKQCLLMKAVEIPSAGINKTKEF